MKVFLICKDYLLEVGGKYWNKLKQKLKEEGNRMVTNCHQLKLKFLDGKYYKNDVVGIKGMFRVIGSIPNKNAASIKVWLAKRIKIGNKEWNFSSCSFVNTKV